MPDMFLPKSLWDENFDGLTEQLGTLVAEGALRLHVDQNHQAVTIDDHHRVGQRFQQFTIRGLGPVRRGGGTRCPRLVRHGRRLVQFRCRRRQAIGASGGSHAFQGSHRAFIRLVRK